MTLRETILLEADYSSVQAIISGIKSNAISIKNGKKLVEDENFVNWVNVIFNKTNERNIKLGPIFNLLVKKEYPSTAINWDGYELYVKYKNTPALKDLINQFINTELNAQQFENQANKIIDNTKSGRERLRKANTKDEDIITLYDKNGWTVKSPKTWQASVKAATFPFGKANWCTAGSKAEEMFNRYTDSGKTTLFIVSNGTKQGTFQCNFGERPEFKNFENEKEPNITNVPDEVLKVCSDGKYSIYQYKRIIKNRKKGQILQRNYDKSNNVLRTVKAQDYDFSDYIRDEKPDVNISYRSPKNNNGKWKEAEIKKYGTGYEVTKTEKQKVYDTYASFYLDNQSDKELVDFLLKKIKTRTRKKETFEKVVKKPLVHIETRPRSFLVTIYKDDNPSYNVYTWFEQGKEKDKEVYEILKKRILKHWMKNNNGKLPIDTEFLKDSDKDPAFDAAEKDVKKWNERIGEKVRLESTKTAKVSGEVGKRLVNSLENFFKINNYTIKQNIKDTRYGSHWLERTERFNNISKIKEVQSVNLNYNKKYLNMEIIFSDSNNYRSRVFVDTRQNLVNKGQGTIIYYILKNCFPEYFEQVRKKNTIRDIAVSTELKENYFNY